MKAPHIRTLRIRRCASSSPLRHAMSGHTTLLISHDLLAVRRAAHIIVIEAGTVIERGSHAELLALEACVRELRGGLFYL